MHNKNIKDQVKRTLYYRFIVGSECINRFNRALYQSEGGSPLVLFDNMARKGLPAFYKGREIGEDGRERIKLNLLGKILSTTMTFCPN